MLKQQLQLHVFGGALVIYVPSHANLSALVIKSPIDTAHAHMQSFACKSPWQETLQNVTTRNWSCDVWGHRKDH